MFERVLCIWINLQVLPMMLMVRDINGRGCVEHSIVAEMFIAETWLFTFLAVGAGVLSLFSRKIGNRHFVLLSLANFTALLGVAIATQPFKMGVCV
ncbi:MAG: hypothetical protein LBQ81_07120 [Zoogloeaceae bacterium]|nr:hypothetical protein [Zoogloeaceae bacterium]